MLRTRKRLSSMLNDPTNVPPYVLRDLEVFRETVHFPFLAPHFDLSVWGTASNPTTEGLDVAAAFYAQGSSFFDCAPDHIAEHFPPLKRALVQK